MKRRSTIDFQEPAINLTPLIDVVFVILILFIVIAPLLEVDQIELASGPSSSEQSVQEMSSITIHVAKDNTITFNKQEVLPDQLLLLLQQAHDRHPDARPQLFHDREATFGTYQEVKNNVEMAGFAHLDVILKPGE